MSEPSLSPIGLDVVTPQKKDYLQTVISEEKNPFHAFDWGHYLITTPQPPPKAKPGLIASSKPSWSASGKARHISNPEIPVDANAWNKIMQEEVWKLASVSNLPWTTLNKLHLARGENDPGLHVIRMGIDVCRPVDKAEAEAFVKQCSDMLALHQFEGTVVEVHHSSYWGGLAER